ncbi:MAG: hypothetical protein E2590_04925 [Chryseobacterium sp.]|nr:hypothetical protein [Chryseobacterium sp.]
MNTIKTFRALEWYTENYDNTKFEFEGEEYHNNEIIKDTYEYFNDTSWEEWMQFINAHLNEMGQNGFKIINFYINKGNIIKSGSLGRSKEWIFHREYNITVVFESK